MVDHPQQLSPETLTALQSWIGREETRHDDLTSAPARGLSATLDRDDPHPQPGFALPPLWHWIYFLPQYGACEIGQDGHPKRGDFLPPVPLPRRMWAGGRLTWERGNPLRVGDTAQRVSRIGSVTHKVGQRGDLVFVTVVHELRNAQGLAVNEEHDIVYRALQPLGETAHKSVPAQREGVWQRELTPDEVLLFRYSALTFNSHRIHYDKPYATSTEGYPGLVVHGPLIATLLLDLLRGEEPHAFVRRFEFKAIRPSFVGSPLHLKGQPQPDGRTIRLWAHDSEGWLAMEALAEFE